MRHASEARKKVVQRKQQRPKKAGGLPPSAARPQKAQAKPAVGMNSTKKKKKPKKRLRRLAGKFRSVLFMCSFGLFVCLFVDTLLSMILHFHSHLYSRSKVKPNSDDANREESYVPEESI